MIYLMATAGLILLLVGGDVLVRGAVSLAKKLKISNLVIGLTVVAFGTSSPELIVCIEAAMQDIPQLAIGNVVGSNIANILLVLGIPALIAPITCDAPTIGRQMATMIIVSIGFIILSYTGTIVAWHGCVMTIGLLGYLTFSYFSTRTNYCVTPAEPTESSEITGNIIPGNSNLWIALSFVFMGIFGLSIGSDLLIRGAVGIAGNFGISEATIGLTVIAIGTSLPELATALMAAIRKHSEVAMGNVIGSNLFNILAIMGITAIVSDIPVPTIFLSFDLWVMLGASTLLIPFVAKKYSIGKIHGTLFTACYATYILVLFNRTPTL